MNKTLLLASIAIVAGCRSVSTDAPTDPTPAPSATDTATPGPTSTPVPDWEWVNPLPSGNGLYSAAFLDANVGIAAGDRGMLSTSDGGATWKPTAPPPLQHIDSIQYTGATTLAALGFNAPSPAEPFAPRSMTSEDGGLTWSVHSFPALPGLYMLDAHFDGATGAAQGSWLPQQGQPGLPVIMVSIDSGKTWVDRTPAGLTGWVSGVFVRGSRIWAVGDDVALRSVDAGANWDTVAMPGAEMISVAFRDDQTGLAVGSAGAIWRTTDGGANWVALGSFGSTLLRRVSFLDATHAIAVGYFGTILVSADAGLTWTASPSAYGPSWYFASPSVGAKVWVVGTRGVILRSEDWGATWTPQTKGWPLHVWRMDFRTPLVGYAAGEHGLILHTSDGGRSWSALQEDHAPYSANGFQLMRNSLWDVFFLDASRGWAVGSPVTNAANQIVANSVILHTADGGATWSPQASNVQRTLKAIAFANENVGWAVGNNVILRTTDAGANWSTVSLSVNPLTDLAVLSPTEAFASGWNVILHTTDAGVTWTQVAHPVGLVMGIRFSDAQHGIACGTHPDLTSGFFLTEDGGATWTDVKIAGEDAILQAVAFDAGGVIGYASATGGEIFRTADGGQTWARDEASPTWLDLTDMRYTDAGFVTSGAFGTILVRAKP